MITAPIETERLRIVLATIVINVVAVSLLALALLGAVNIPFYEEMAKRIHWWQYHNCRMISYTPYYIILGEFGIALALAVLARTDRRGSWKVAIFSGAAGGAAIFVCYAIAFGLTD